MNITFSTWTRSTAFCLTLTGEAVQLLLFLAHCDADCVSHGKDPGQYPWTGTRTAMAYLLRRGLIEPTGGGYRLTEAGKLTASLVVEAGFLPERSYGTAFANEVHT